MLEITKILKRFDCQKRMNKDRKKWQSTEIKDFFWECENFIWTVPSPDWDKEKAIEELQPQVEWCEAHFKERIGGEPLNPPPSHTMWNCKTSEFLSQDGKFSHTYPERFWPKSLMPKGIRFNTADYDTVVEVLKKDRYTRQCFLPIFFNEDLTASLENERVPCTLGYYFYYKEGYLNCNYIIRSIDVIRHLNNDLYLTFLLLQDLSQKLDMRVGKIVLIAFNMHCFGNDQYTLKQRIKNYEEVL